MIVYICGTEMEAGRLMREHLGCTGTDLLFTTPHDRLGLLGVDDAVAYVVTPQANLLALNNDAYREKLHTTIMHAEYAMGRSTLRQTFGC